MSERHPQPDSQTDRQTDRELSPKEVKRPEMFTVFLGERFVPHENAHEA